jgi:hypothetical protein
MRNPTAQRSPPVVDDGVERGEEQRTGRIFDFGFLSFDCRKEQKCVRVQAIERQAVGVGDVDGLHGVSDEAEFLALECNEPALAELEEREPACSSRARRRPKLGNGPAIALDVFGTQRTARGDFGEEARDAFAFAGRETAGPRARDPRASLHGALQVRPSVEGQGDEVPGVREMMLESAPVGRGQRLLLATMQVPYEIPLAVAADAVAQNEIVHAPAPSARRRSGASLAARDRAGGLCGEPHSASVKFHSR